MPEIELKEAWIFAGTTYLPGKHTVDAPLAAIFEARGAFGKQAVPGQPAELVPVGAPASPPAAPQAPKPDTGDQLEALVGTKAATALRTAGYGTAEAWGLADDTTLLALDGVGAATVQKLRDQA